jgi:hypothetical protein
MTSRPIMMACLAALGATTGCVQKAYDRVVIFRVDVSEVPDVKSVGLRGTGDPLSWQRELPMRLVPDSAGLYEVVVTRRTGSLSIDVKFTVNGEFEFQDAENRTVRLAPTTVGNDTTWYRGVFNVR